MDRNTPRKCPRERRAEAAAAPEKARLGGVEMDRLRTPGDTTTGD
jgi:hypothetical protein